MRRSWTTELDQACTRGQAVARRDARASCPSARLASCEQNALAGAARIEHRQPLLSGFRFEHSQRTNLQAVASVVVCGP